MHNDFTYFIKRKINTCSIYHSCLFEKMEWVNKCESILRKLKVLDSYIKFVILCEHNDILVLWDLYLEKYNQI